MNRRARRWLTVIATLAVLLNAACRSTRLPRCRGTPSPINVTVVETQGEQGHQR